jgi:hypothetical protein
MKLAGIAESQNNVAAVKANSPQALRRRKHLRYPLAADAKYQWTIRNFTRGKGEGKSRDVSEGGAFVLTESLPPVGALINVSIQLPAWQIGATSLRMEMTGEVIRVEVPPGREMRWGFAIASAKTQLHRPEERQPLSEGNAVAPLEQ